jgi:hypothetical protein
MAGSLLPDVPGKSHGRMEIDRGTRYRCTYCRFVFVRDAAGSWMPLE